MTAATFRLPGPLAIAVAQVDQMSGGRVEFGLGAGWFEAEHTAYAMPFPSLGERFDRYEEQLAVITGLWTVPEGEKFSYAGRYYSVTDSPGLPKPAQRPRPPVLIGGGGKRRTPELAARYADEFNVPFASVDDTSAGFGRVRAACAAAGRAESSMTYSVAQTVCCGRTDAELRRRAEATGRDLDDLRKYALAGSPPRSATGWRSSPGRARSGPTSRCSTCTISTTWKYWPASSSRRRPHSERRGNVQRGCRWHWHPRHALAAHAKGPVMVRLRSRRLLLWLVSGVAAVAVLAVGGAFVYIHFISGPAPAPLSLKPGGSGGASASGPAASAPPSAAGHTALSGTWKVARGSVVGYRVKEVLVGQNNIAVGRTHAITGTLTISGTRVTAAQFTVQMATIKSDESQRDVQFNGRIMETSTYPTGTLRLTSPIALAPVPAAGVVKVYRATATSRCTATPGRSASRSAPNAPAPGWRCPAPSRSCSPTTTSATRASAAS